MFSVIIPVYNGEKFVEKAIESVFARSFSDRELIIVNDGTFNAVEFVNGEKIEKCSFFEGREETVYLPDFFLEYHKDKSAKMFTVITTCFSAEAIKKWGGFPVGKRENLRKVMEWFSMR